MICSPSSRSRGHSIFLWILALEAHRKNNADSGTGTRHAPLAGQLAPLEGDSSRRCKTSIPSSPGVPESAGLSGLAVPDDSVRCYWRAYLFYSDLVNSLVVVYLLYVTQCPELVQKRLPLRCLLLTATEPYCCFGRFVTATLSGSVKKNNDCIISSVGIGNS